MSDEKHGEEQQVRLDADAKVISAYLETINDKMRTGEHYHNACFEIAAFEMAELICQDASHYIMQGASPTVVLSGLIAGQLQIFAYMGYDLRDGGHEIDQCTDCGPVEQEDGPRQDFMAQVLRLMKDAGADPKQEKQD